MKSIKVFVNDGVGKRKVLNAELLKDRPRSVLVALPDGNIVVRKKSRDLVT